MNERTAVLACENLAKSFVQGSVTVPVLTEVTLSVPREARVAIVGASGSGKSTLLHLLGGLDRPSAGVVRVAGVDLASLSDTTRGRLRNQQLGFIYQFHHLLPEFSALENVAMPLLVRRVAVSKARQRAAQLLAQVGLEARMQHKPAQLSGGERQRAAVARALAGAPECVLADEPTGNLDGHNAEQVYELMLELNRTSGTSLVIVTHDPQLARRMDQVYLLEDGQLRPQVIN